MTFTQHVGLDQGCPLSPAIYCATVAEALAQVEAYRAAAEKYGHWYSQEDVEDASALVQIGMASGPP